MNSPRLPFTSKPLLTGPKRQHFLPRFYLEGFCQVGLLAVYDREGNEVRLQQPINTGLIGHFYTLIDEQGRQRFELEKLLCDFESKAKTPLVKLAARELLSEEERADFAIFVATAAFRTPERVDWIKETNSSAIAWAVNASFQDFDEVREGLRRRSGGLLSEEELDAEAKELVDFVGSGNYRIRTHSRWAVRLAIEMGLNIAPILAARDWIVVHRQTAAKSFVTTDDPVTLGSAQPSNGFWGTGFASTDAIVTFPLTQSCALIMLGQGGSLRHKDAPSSDAVRKFNLGTASQSQRFVIGRDAALVRALVDRVNRAEPRSGADGSTPGHRVRSPVPSR